MAVKKKWFEKIKSRIAKLDFLKLKNNRKEKLKEKELPDLITPTNEKINEIQREEAIRVKIKDFEINNLDIKNRPEKDVTDGRKRSSSNR